MEVIRRGIAETTKPVSYLLLSLQSHFVPECGYTFVQHRGLVLPVLLFRDIWETRYRQMKLGKRKDFQNNERGCLLEETREAVSAMSQGALRGPESEVPESEVPTWSRSESGGSAHSYLAAPAQCPGALLGPVGSVAQALNFLGRICIKYSSEVSEGACSGLWV